MIPQPARWSRATPPIRPVSRTETELIEFVRQLRIVARAVAIRAPTISYCEPFAIANPLRFGDSSPCGSGRSGRVLGRQVDVFQPHLSASDDLAVKPADRHLPELLGRTLVNRLGDDADLTADKR